MSASLSIVGAALAVAAALQESETPPGKLALRGLDPVALCQGTETLGLEEFVVSHGRHHYRFDSEENLKRFRADPELWGVQWGGACARMGPLSGRGRPGRFLVHEGHIYLFASNTCLATFKKAPERYVEQPKPPKGIEPAAAKEGRAWLAKAVAAHGGAERVAAAKALRLSLQQEVKGWKQERELLCDAGGGTDARDRGSRRLAPRSRDGASCGLESSSERSPATSSRSSGTSIVGAVLGCEGRGSRPQTRSQRPRGPGD